MSLNFLEVLILEAFWYPCLQEREGAFLGLDASSFYCLIPDSSSLLQVFPQLGSTGLAGVRCRQLWNEPSDPDLPVKTDLAEFWLPRHPNSMLQVLWSTLSHCLGFLLSNKTLNYVNSVLMHFWLLVLFSASNSHLHFLK